MKKTKIYPIVFAAALSMTACTEVLEPSVDYGGNTYINDYTALVKAVNDLQKSLDERFDALNTLLKAGMLDMKLAIDENTGAIKVLEATTKDGLDKVNTSLIDGFTVISGDLKSLEEQLKLNNDNIVFAINENGQLLRAKIDETGKLIEATLLANNKALVDCINSNGKTLQERLAALNAIIYAGLKEVKVSIDATTGAIKVMDTNVNNSLDTINTSLVDGFTKISESVDSAGNKIVTAMNTNGQLLKLAIDEHGKLIDTSLKSLNETLGKVYAALVDQTATLKSKLEALNALLENGLAQVNTNLGKLDTDLGGIGATLDLQKAELVTMNGNLGTINTTLNTQYTAINKALGELKTELNSDFTVIGKKMDTHNVNIVTAMNEYGEAIEVAINNQGYFIGTKVADFSGKQDELKTALESLKEAVNSLTGQEKENAEGVIEAIEKLLADGTTSMD